MRVTHDDANPTNGNYVDPDPTVEVEDINDYYSSDFEAGISRMTDDYGMRLDSTEKKLLKHLSLTVMYTFCNIANSALLTYMYFCPFQPSMV